MFLQVPYCMCLFSLLISTYQLGLITCAGSRFHWGRQERESIIFEGLPDGHSSSSYS